MATDKLGQNRRIKTVTLLFVVVLFFGFLFGGYKLAEKVFPPKVENLSSSATPSALEVAGQQDYLLLQFNNLDEKDPELISLWVVLHSAEPYSELFFVSLYPTADASINSQIKSIVSLKNNHSLRLSSLRRLARVFDLDLQGQFAFDNTAFLNFAAIAGVEQIAVFNASADSAETAAAIQASGKTFYSAFCSLDSSGASNSFFSQLDLPGLMPAHLTSSFSAEDLQALFEQASQAADAPSCQVVIP